MPVQSGHAPCGLLKEKVRGAISPREIPHWTQANCSLNSASSPGVRVQGLNDACAEPQRCLNGIRHSAAEFATFLGDDEAVDDDLNGVPLLLVEADVFGEVADFAVDASTNEPAAACLIQQAVVLTLLAAD